jgi:hypothetical protein
MISSRNALLRLYWVVPLSAFLSSALLAGQDQPSEPVQEVVSDQLNEIVVSRRKGAPPAKLDATGYLQRHCFDANRLSGRSAPPEDDLSWEPIDDTARAQFGISDPEVPAFGLADEARGHTLLIKFETFRLKNDLREDRCTLVVIGGEDHAELPDRISAMFKGRGTQRHVGHRDGSEKIDGWQQWLWTAMPSRRSKAWQSINGRSGGRASDSWVVIVDDSFFDRYDYVFVDLKTRQGAGAKLSMLTFGSRTREKGTPEG